ncbi:MAG: NAD-dependent epimerase/dehydratase family protein [Bacteroidetes bacterium]|nr:NAD-dependent epimerase/dehydratase family protein [Bacteroidota bacterium]
MAENILVVGACGQVGTELVLTLREKHPNKIVVASDIKPSSNEEFMQGGPFETLDVLNKEQCFDVVKKHGISQVYNLAALLSATAEKNPEFGWKLNMEGHFNILDLAREGHLKRIFWPSSIAVFGPSTPKQNTPQDCIMDPSTVYGISKLAGERWCEYYHKRWGVDIRSVRYPGLISYKSLPGGGTTDYAVEIFYEAIKNGRYTSFLGADTALPMMYMPDAIKATIDSLEADPDLMKVRSSYNVGAFSFNPEQLAGAIKKHMPEFEIDYNPDFRQQIANGWPQSINDQTARNDWGWSNEYDLDAMVFDMLENLKRKLAVTE